MNTTNYASSNSCEDADVMFFMHTFSNVCCHAYRCVLCSSRRHIKHLVPGDGTVQGGKYWALFQGNTRRRLMHRVTKESSSHMSNKNILIDSHRLKNVKIVSCFSEIQFLHSSSFSVSFFFVLFGFDSSALKTPESFLSYFIFQVYVILLNQPGSTEKGPRTVAMFQHRKQWTAPQ